MRLIDAKELERQTKEAFKENPVVMGALLRWIRKQPTIDAVPVVRCKDCKHGLWDDDEELWKCVFSADWSDENGFWYGAIEYHDGDDFCSYGERKDGDGNG